MIALAAARAVASRALRAAGVPAEPATRTADLLVTAEAWGVGSHGLLRLPRYLARLAAGGVRADAELEVRRDSGVVLAYDGHDGLGHWQLWQAAEEAAVRARRHGVAVASVGRSSHCGALGLYTAPGLRHGLATLVVSTGPAVMAPPGGAVPLLSTSPIAVGIPAPGGHAIVDLATSAVARGRIAAAARSGRPLPEGWAVDSAGVPTTDPAAALGGMLAPLGGAKGFALAVAVEALAGAVVGPNLAVDVADIFDPARDAEPQGIGHLLVVIDPGVLDVDGAGPDRIARLLTTVAEVGGHVPGAARILPGELPDDLPLEVPDTLVDELRSWGEHDPSVPAGPSSAGGTEPGAAGASTPLSSGHDDALHP